MSSSTEIISHWSTLIENFNTSPQDFYEAVTESIQKREMPNVRIDRITLKESHFLSAKREYLRISCKNEFYFAICGAPFGTGFFVSWWLLQPPAAPLVALFARLPLLYLIARALVKPWTYYRMDTATMFRTATHQAVLEVVDLITSKQGNTILSEGERKPVMKEFFLQ